jgi:hypothetical protein
VSEKIEPIKDLVFAAYEAALKSGADSAKESAELDKLLQTRARSTDALERRGRLVYDDSRAAAAEGDATMEEPAVPEGEAPTAESFIVRIDPACARPNGGVGGFGPEGISRTTGDLEIAQAMGYKTPAQARRQIFQRSDAGFVWAVVSGTNVTTPGGIAPDQQQAAALYSNVESLSSWGAQVRQDESEKRRQRVPGWSGPTDQRPGSPVTAPSEARFKS